MVEKILSQNSVDENSFFPVTSIHPATIHCPLPPILSSVKSGWSSIYLEYHHQPPGEIPQSYCQKYSLCIKTKTCTKEGKSERWFNDQFQNRSMAKGDFFIVPPKTFYRGRWDYPIDFILIGLEPKLVNRIAYESIDPELVEIMPIFPQSDPFILQIGLALKKVLETNLPDSSMYAETMANALSVHLLQYYSTSKFKLSEYTDGLPKYKLKRVIEYVDEYLERNLTIAELAQLVQMSPHYFGRLFKQSMGITPYKYILQCRIDRSKALLRNNELTIAQIAQTVGFAHQSHLNYHFKRLVKITPKQFRDG